MKEVQLQFTIEEVNVILEGLGNLPFIKVYHLIEKIQGQAARQMSDSDSGQVPVAPKTAALVAPANP